jgi:glycosyltransferase involved in cell wall biosynthesis
MLVNSLVSIIIPTFNRAHLISETLDSILAQTYQNWECIIVDDGSIDETELIVQVYIEKDSRFQYHRRPQDRPEGGNAARNYGFEVSNGEYVNWFDDDDVMHHDKLFLQVESLSKSDFNFSVCQTLVFEKSIENIIGYRCENIQSTNVLYDYIVHNINWLTQAPLWRKEFLKTLDYLFDESLKAAQEWEFHCRVLFYCEHYSVTNQALVYIRRHTNSLTYNGNDKKRIWNYYIARKKVNSLLKNSKYDLLLKDYFKSYFVEYFQQLIVDRSLKKALAVCFSSIGKYYTFTDKILLYFYIVFRCYFGIGYRFKHYFKL